MITISDLNVSQESYLTELQDAEMIGDIVGGFFGLGVFTAAPRLRVDVVPSTTAGTPPTITASFRIGTLTLFGRLAAEFTANLLP
ncbi:hypothetical protein [Moorena sp. SIO3H5]|uniref:hypothetical protein n=1 Tax=Moorena sp. SIO3H5 TaxID=2607834 RepID=UPI0013BE343A|nr:hypothetical protein [Moorena sp. SIO3H5]NEO70668.1 hypothetical protein [Moorena sp. SIO3H5]